MNSIDQICCWSGDVFVVAVVDWTVDTELQTLVSRAREHRHRD